MAWLGYFCTVGFLPDYMKVADYDHILYTIHSFNIKWHNLELLGTFIIVLDGKHQKDGTASKDDATTIKPAAADTSSSKPLLSKSAVLRMLSEFVKSYPSCANIVVQHSYMAGQSDSVNEVCVKTV